MAMPEVEVDFDEVVHESDSAWKVKIGDKEVWLPKSQCDLDEYNDVVTMPEWLAKKEGLI